MESKPSENLSPIEYYGMIQTENNNFLEELKYHITNVPEGVTVILGGSDGKEEKNISSKAELIVIGGDRKLLEEFVKSIEENDDPFLKLHLSKPIEIHTDSEKDNFCFAFGNKHAVYPDRIFNSTLLAGDVTKYKEYRAHVLFEATRRGKEGSHVRDNVKGQLRDYIKAIQTGQFRGNFLWKDGSQLYQTEPLKERTVGFKIAFIRAVQRKLDLLTIYGIKNNKFSVDFALTLPSNTVGRISALREYFSFPPDVEEAYIFFLREYHNIQEKMKRAKEVKPDILSVTLPFDQQLFNKYSSIILGFVNNTQNERDSN